MKRWKLEQENNVRDFLGKLISVSSPVRAMCFHVLSIYFRNYKVVKWPEDGNGRFPSVYCLVCSFFDEKLSCPFSIVAPVADGERQTLCNKTKFNHFYFAKRKRNIYISSFLPRLGRKVFSASMFCYARRQPACYGVLYCFSPSRSSLPTLFFSLLIYFLCLSHGIIDCCW